MIQAAGSKMGVVWIFWISRCFFMKLGYSILADVIATSNTYSSSLCCTMNIPLMRTMDCTFRLNFGDASLGVLDAIPNSPGG